MYAQTSMRIEKQFLAYGHDMDTDTSPLATPLGFAIAWDTDFIGRDALMKSKYETPAMQIATLLFDDPNAWPLGNEPIYQGDRIIGQTTSATYGHRVSAHVAIASVSRDAIDAVVDVDIGGKRWAARAQTKAVFDPTGGRLKMITPRVP